jgi:transposase
MITVGIDVSKGKSTVAAMKPGGEIVLAPFDVTHSASAMSDLAESLKALDGEVRIALEHTGKYHQPIARCLSDAGLFVSVINPKLIHDFGNNSIRVVKTDPADAMKIANYAILHWNDLEKYSSEDETRLRKCMIANAAKSVFLYDKSKLGKRFLFKVCHSGDLAQVITED